MCDTVSVTTLSLIFRPHAHTQIEFQSPFDPQTKARRRQDAGGKLLSDPAFCIQLHDLTSLWGLIFGSFPRTINVYMRMNEQTAAGWHHKKDRPRDPWIDQEDRAHGFNLHCFMLLFHHFSVTHCLFCFTCLFVCFLLSSSFGTCVPPLKPEARNCPSRLW